LQYHYLIQYIRDTILNLNSFAVLVKYQLYKLILLFDFIITTKNLLLCYLSEVKDTIHILYNSLFVPFPILELKHYSLILLNKTDKINKLIIANLFKVHTLPAPAHTKANFGEGAPSGLVSGEEFYK
jgi:hypothetical protein